MIINLETHIHILQLEGYEPLRFLQWWLRHPFARKISQKKPLVWTIKAKLVKNLVIFFFCLSLLSLVLDPSWWTLLFLFLNIFTPFLILLSLLVISPLEVWKRQQVFTRTQKTLQRLNKKNLIPIGITGSFGKTATKDFLYEFLRELAPTVKTPESYNTTLGISHTVEMELLPTTRYFLCEMDAYFPGEIRSLTKMVDPEYAVLTAVGTQHLERFGSLEKITDANFELIDAVDPRKAIANWDSPPIRERIQRDRKYSQVKTYSLLDPQTTFFVEKHRYTDKGLEFSLRYGTQTHNFTVQLFGTNNLQNIVAALSLLHLWGVPPEVMQKGIRHIKPSPHRLEVKHIGKAKLIDNSFSSNETGFCQTLEDLTALDGKKVLITPGIIELGSRSQKVHQDLGTTAAAIFSQIYLVGDSERTKTFAQAAKKANPSIEIETLPNNANLWPLIDELGKTYDWILLENDLPDNYE